MDLRIAAAAIVLTSLGFIGGSAMTHEARAQEGAEPNTSCSSSTPCLFESNTSTGPGVKSMSSHGNGLIATTKALGSSSTNAASALLGIDLQTKTGDGLLNFGVNGTSTNGTGVQGSGGAVGVSGIATSATGVAVEATVTNTSGLLFEGTGKEIGPGLPVFTLDAFGHAVFGIPTAGYETGSVTVNQYCGNGNPMYEGDDQHGMGFQIIDCGDINEPGYAFIGTSLDTT